MINIFKLRLLASTMIAGTVAMTPAFAQNATSAAQPAADDTSKDIVVTGTLFRSSADNIASPVTVMTADDIAKRGITTVQGAIQTLASNNGPALTNSFTANGAFAGGASAVSMRGLSTNSTLVLFDGLRAAYYPLADDGSRNFVDLNTIPDEIVERVDVLKDGASSTYGADAVAGVVNIITKKQITGISGMAEGGINQRGVAGNQRVSLTAGFGDLASQGFNVYVSGHYINQDKILSRDVPAPFNSSNQTGICFEGNCGADGRNNSPINFAGISTLVPVYLVRPANSATNAAIPGSKFQFLNPTTGCGGFTPYTLTAAQQAGFPTAPSTVCVQDVVHDGGTVEPHNRRWGVSSRASVNIGSDAHAYLEFNFEQSTTSYTGFGAAGPGFPTNSVIRANGPAGINYPRFSTAGVPGGANAPGSAVLSLPVYICPRLTVGACTAANGTLNPNNPFASAGQNALIIGTMPDLKQDTATRSRAYRVATGIDGSFNDNWDYSINAIGMVNDLRRSFDGYVYIQHLLDVIKDGSYNFVNPFSNSQAVRDYMAPHLDTGARSEMYEVDANLSHDFFELPGGSLQVAVGGSIRKESVNAPSANSDADGPTQRYFVINAFGTVGSRWVESPYFEIKAPILTSLNVDLSGRYDNYSSGQHAFSPKAGVVFTPVRQLVVRGAISKGFRIPSFGESSALPTTGFVPVTLATLPAAYLAQYSNPGVTCTATTVANCSSYLTSNSVGEQSIANPNLKPEKSRNISAGIDIKPFRGIKFSVDYYNIRKTNAITAAPYAAALNAYYAGQPIPAGYTVTPQAPDVNHPNALPLVGVVGAPYINANTIKTDGLDFAASVTFHFANGWSIESMADAEYIHKLNTYFPDGHVEKYAGTLGNFNLTAGSGTPRWKGNWQNTLEFGGKGSITATAYYTAGYDLSAQDQGTDYKDCGLSSGIQPCQVRRFIDVDLTGQINVGKAFTFYANILNVFDVKPPLDTVTYGGYLYNPVVAEAGIIGRAFRVGGRFKF
ncbi:MAG TPA: TonB-dependent receptor [Sphingomonas sp.]|uniref:TonB-dependent receptor plug domain-containing protein n=1 Tax=Sphingomonas sp. TaxID=28214 RepID=UPI002CAFCF89|nr:TonB-dependent receptor [Sphingomonas sp.]HMI19701.1 TonB-dependent receptor [Sphingomonas sp.]